MDIVSRHSRWVPFWGGGYGGADVVKICSVGSAGDISAIRRRFGGAIVCWLFKGVDRFIAPTNLVADELIEQEVDLRRIRIIPNVLDDAAVREVSEVELEILCDQLGIEGKQVVLYVGRLSRKSISMFYCRLGKASLRAATRYCCLSGTVLNGQYPGLAGAVAEARISDSGRACGSARPLLQGGRFIRVSFSFGVIWECYCRSHDLWTSGYQHQCGGHPGLG